MDLDQIFREGLKWPKEDTINFGSDMDTGFFLIKGFFINIAW